MKSPRVSVIITAYNNSAVVEQAIRSVTEQEVPSQLIVVDDASTDQTVAVAEGLLATLAFEFIRLPQNVGVAAARDVGLRSARGEFINFLDGDDYLLPGKLAAQLTWFDRDPKLDVCYCDAQIRRGTRMLDFTLKQIWPPARHDMLTRLLEGNCIALHSALVRAEVARAVGFDERLRRAEDWDFWLRAAINGARFAFLDQALVVYRRDGQSLSRNLLPALEDGWRVLAGIDEAKLSRSQVEALQHYRQGILLHRADILIRRGSRSGLKALTEAAEYGSIGSYRNLSRQLLGVSFSLGRLFYLLAAAAAEFKHRREHRNLSAF